MDEVINVICIISVVGIIYLMFRVRQGQFFFNHMQKIIDDIHHRRMALIRDHMDPDLVLVLDIKASCKLLDLSWPWNYDFESMMVYKVAD